MVRHAKSSWENNLPDHQRPLNNRGESDAVIVSSYVSKQLAPPDKILVSTATRAQNTAAYFIKAFSISLNDVKNHSELYDFSGQSVMEVIKNSSDNINTLMIVGHNHAFTSIANILGNVYFDNIPTCGFVKIDFNVTQWKQISTGKTSFKVFPKDLK